MSINAILPLTKLLPGAIANRWTEWIDTQALWIYEVHCVTPGNSFLEHSEPEDLSVLSGQHLPCKAGATVAWQIEFRKLSKHLIIASGSKWMVCFN